MKYREKMKKLKKIITDGIITDESCNFAEKCANDKRAGEYAKKVLEHIKKYKDIEIKLNELLEKDIVSDDNMEFLEYAANSMYDADRDDAAIILGKCSGERAKKLLFKLAEDKWEITRYSAYKSVVSFKSDDVYNFLVNRLEKEKDITARCYVVKALRDMCIENGMYNAEKLLNIFVEKEKTAKEREKIEICGALVLLGKGEYIEKIFDGLWEKNKYVRYWAAGILADELINKDNCALICKKLKRAYEKEITGKEYKLGYKKSIIEGFYKRTIDFINDIDKL